MTQSSSKDNGNSKATLIRTALQYFQAYQQTVARLPYHAIDQAALLLARAYEEGRNIFLFGNGGSASLASHFACDLSKGTAGFTNDRKRFRAMALTDNLPLLTAWANDSSYENIFAEQLSNFIGHGDMVFAISGSGNSPNVLRALELAREAGAFNIGLTGFQGGTMKRLCDLCIIVPSNNMQVIEDLHLSATHAIFTCICQHLQEQKERDFSAYSKAVQFTEPLEQRRGADHSHFVDASTKTTTS
ncbi:MAG TPA: SIS domain-containing protein [Terriglobales bacterium]|nr:SIS domain-containing protein [Terriglobales bacterium]